MAQLKYLDGILFREFVVPIYPDISTSLIIKYYFEAANEIYKDSIKIQTKYLSSSDKDDSLIDIIRDDENEISSYRDNRFIIESHMKLLFPNYFKKFQKTCAYTYLDMNMMEKVFCNTSKLFNDIFTKNLDIDSMVFDNEINQLELNPIHVSIFENYVTLPFINTYIVSQGGNISELVGYWNNLKASKANIINNRIKVVLTKHGGESKYAIKIYISLTKDKLSLMFKCNEEWLNKKFTRAVGIDLGARKSNWIVDSNGTRVERPNVEGLSRNLERIRTMKEKMINSEESDTEKLVELKIKEEILMSRIHSRISAKAMEYAEKLLEQKPIYVVMETISEEGMFYSEKDQPNERKRNSHNSNIRTAHLEELSDMLYGYLAEQGINVIKAHNRFASTKSCSRCGKRNNVGRCEVYRCRYCGLVINRDENATINLINYPIIECNSKYGKARINQFKRRFSDEIYENIDTELKIKYA